MVEVPAAAIAVDLFDAAFFSIGSNDLTQYVTAAGRDIGAVADLADPLASRGPAARPARRRARPRSRPRGQPVRRCRRRSAVLPHLLAAGLRSVSVSPAALARTKATIAGLRLDRREAAP